MPTQSDPTSRAKRALIEVAAECSKWRPIFPEYDRSAPIFDAHAARKMLEGVSLVIADLSLARPSCYFELGFAEALAKPISLLAERGTDIHQTGSRDDVRFYSGLGDFERVVRQVLVSTRFAAPAMRAPA